MAQALITINGVPGSNDDLPIGTPVLLSNQDSGGEFFYFWEILDQPPGTADSIVPNNVRDTSFTPNKEGSYLIQLTVNNNTEITNRAVAAVRFIKTRERAPAAQEQTEVSTSKGWGDATNHWFTSLDSFVADPGVVIGIAEVPMNEGDVIQVSPLSGFAVIKSGLPGQETIVQFNIANGNVLSYAPLFMCLGRNDGTPSVAVGEVVRARLFGLWTTSFSFTPTVGDTLYVDGFGVLTNDPTAAAVPRAVGYVVGEPSSGVFAIYFNGLMPSTAAIDLFAANTASVGLSPSNTIRLVNDSNVLKASIDGSAYAPISGGAGTSEFDLGVYFLGKPDADEIVLRYTFNQAVDFAANFSGSHATVEEPATITDADFDVIKDDGLSETVIGLISYGVGGNTATFLSGSPVSFAIGQSIKIVGPSAAANPTLSGLSINLKGTRV